MKRKPGDPLTEREEAILDKLLRETFPGKDPGFERPPDEAIVGWLDGTATDTQRELVADAMAKSEAFCRELLETADDLETLRRDDAGEPLPVPELAPAAIEQELAKISRDRARGAENASRPEPSVGPGRTTKPVATGGRNPLAWLWNLFWRPSFGYAAAASMAMVWAFAGGIQGPGPVVLPTFTQVAVDGQAGRRGTEATGPTLTIQRGQLYQVQFNVEVNLDRDIRYRFSIHEGHPWPLGHELGETVVTGSTGEAGRKSHLLLLLDGRVLDRGNYTLHLVFQGPDGTPLDVDEYWSLLHVQ